MASVLELLVQVLKCLDPSMEIHVDRLTMLDTVLNVLRMKDSDATVEVDVKLKAR